MSSLIMALGGNPRQSRGLRGAHKLSAERPGFTLVEMLIAMAITLVMIGAVVTLFANISNGVRNRRAVVEMSGQLRHARNMLQKDLQGATCNGLVWQRPDENQGYIEIIEGPQREGDASVLVDRVTNNTPGTNFNPEINHATSLIPASNLPFPDATWHTDGGGLGDSDDTLMLTVRNEHEPFIGRVPKTDGSITAVRRLGNEAPVDFRDWEPATIESPLAEVVWFAIENPDEDRDGDGFFGEPGMRTIYRRALLIAPWLNPYRTTHPTTGEVDDTFQLDGQTITAQPGLLRVLNDNLNNSSADNNDRREAIASLIAFQERYDISARLEWDPLMGSDGRWKIVANTLGDLTKRENRFGHVGYGYNNAGGFFARNYPFPMSSQGVGHTSNNLLAQFDPELPPVPPPTPPPPLNIRAMISSNNTVFDYDIQEGSGGYVTPPFLYFTENIAYQATPRAILDDEGKIVRVVHGPTPLSGARKGEDVMLSDALGFDLRVYDPGAPLFAHTETETVLEPTDPAWINAYLHNDNSNGSGVNKTSAIGENNGSTNVTFPFIGQGAYVDLGYGVNRYGTDLGTSSNVLPAPRFASAFSNSTTPWFFPQRTVNSVNAYNGAWVTPHVPLETGYVPLATGYAVFDTWSLHYENNGLNEDQDEVEGGTWQPEDYDGTGVPQVDEGTNGLEDPGHYVDTSTSPPQLATQVRLGPDDVGEREAMPPYDKPLRGMQVVLRLFERDSRQIRQVSVNQSFVPE